jgi:hypothetical protein
MRRQGELKTCQVHGIFGMFCCYLNFAVMKSNAFLGLSFSLVDNDNA